MKNYQALAVGVIAGLVVSAVCCDKKPLPKPPPKPSCPRQKCPCKDCYYERYKR